MAKMGGHEARFAEHNNHPQGRSGSGTPKKTGPVKRASGNPTTRGGINRPTKGR